MKKTTTQCLILLATILLFQAQSEAGMILEFQETTFETASGGTVEIQLLLRDTMPTDSLGFDHPSFAGLFGGGGRILQTAGLAGLSISGSDISSPFVMTTRYPVDAAFPVADPTNVAGLLGVVGFFDPPITPGPDNSILLGTFQFTLTGSPGESATISAAQLDLSPSFIENVGFAGALDPLIDSYGTATITVAGSNVTPVPEPSSLFLFLCGTTLTSVAGVRHFRKERNRTARKKPA